MEYPKSPFDLDSLFPDHIPDLLRHHSLWEPIRLNRLLENIFPVHIGYYYDVFKKSILADILSFNHLVSSPKLYFRATSHVIFSLALFP